jgi:type III pantothenate kinase
VLMHHSQLPLRVRVDHPERVGIDRLLNAVAVNALREEGRAAVIVDAGTAVTVDIVDAEGAFRGGFIIPGIRLMAGSLHNYTAQLPLITDFRNHGAIPPANTEDAIREGIRETLAGGIARLARLLREQVAPEQECDCYVTGGDAAAVLPSLAELRPLHSPTLTLEGIRLAAEGKR